MQKFKAGHIIDSGFVICLIVDMGAEYAKVYQFHTQDMSYLPHNDGVFARVWERIDLLDD